LAKSKEDGKDDFDNVTEYATVLYLRKALEWKPAHNKLVICKFDDFIALKSCDLGKHKLQL
jgi:hypothetical protein